MDAGACMLALFRDAAVGEPAWALGAEGIQCCAEGPGMDERFDAGGGGVPEVLVCTKGKGGHHSVCPREEHSLLKQKWVMEGHCDCRCALPATG